MKQIKYIVMGLVMLLSPVMSAVENEAMCTTPTVNVNYTEVVMTGTSVTLKATGNAKYYVWSPATALSTIDQPTTIARPRTSTVYTVTGYNDAAQNMLQNGSFESGNTGFTTDYKYKNNPQGGGFYNIGTEPDVLWSGYNHKTYGYCYAHNGQGKKFFIADGADEANVVVWGQTVNVTPNTDYVLSYWVVSLLATQKNNAPAQLQIFVNGTQIGPVFPADVELNNWTQFYDIWNSGSATTATIEIRNQNTVYKGNDFGLDDIVFAPLDEACSMSKQVTVLVMKRKSESQTLCPDDLPYSWHGKELTEAGTYKDTLVSVAGFRDSVVTLTLTLDDDLCPPTPPEPTCVDTLVYRKWTDVLFCDNGQRQIVSYQWYKDNAPLNGETKQYLYFPDGMGMAAYFVRATYQDGTVVESCPKVFEDTPASANTYGNMNKVIRRGGTLYIAVPAEQESTSYYTLLGQPLN